MFNEISILITTYPILLFTGYFNATQDLQYNTGWTMIIMILVNVLVNLSIILLENFRGMRRMWYRVRRWQWQRRVKKYQLSI